MAERRERERLIEEEHDKMQESILALLKNRDKRKAEKTLVMWMKKL